MHLLILGTRGQLGSALVERLQHDRHVRVTGWNRPAYDITAPAIADALCALQPDVVINCAAWTDVDGAEAHPDEAYAANALGPKYLAQGCAACGALLVHISTNEVFPGLPGVHYREYDCRQPAGVYARSKHAGEEAIHHCHNRWIIARVAWLFSPYGSNFPSKILAAADKQSSLRLVQNEFGNPTYAPDAAAAIVQLIEQERLGIYHIVNEGCASRFELAQQLLTRSGRNHVALTAIDAAEWPRPAPPPLHAVLVNQAAAAYGIRLRDWRDAVDDFVKARVTADQPIHHG